MKKNTLAVLLCLYSPTLLGETYLWRDVPGTVPQLPGACAIGGDIAAFGDRHYVPSSSLGGAWDHGRVVTYRRDATGWTEDASPTEFGCVSNDCEWGSGILIDATQKRLLVSGLGGSTVLQQDSDGMVIEDLPGIFGAIFKSNGTIEAMVQNVSSPWEITQKVFSFGNSWTEVSSSQMPSQVGVNTTVRVQYDENLKKRFFTWSDMSGNTVDLRTRILVQSYDTQLDQWVDVQNIVLPLVAIRLVAEESKLYTLTPFKLSVYTWSGSQYDLTDSMTANFDLQQGQTRFVSRGHVSYVQLGAGGNRVPTIHFVGADGKLGPALTHTAGNCAATFVASGVNKTQAILGNRFLEATSKFGDFNLDGVVGIAEFGMFRTAFGSSIGSSKYRADADYNGDGTINEVDFAAFRASFGK